jgi:hypothetical protein
MSDMPDDTTTGRVAGQWRMLCGFWDRVWRRGRGARGFVGVQAERLGEADAMLLGVDADLAELVLGFRE